MTDHSQSYPVTELLPCPFCGSKSVDPAFWATADCCGPGCDACGATAETGEKWNNRAGGVAQAAWQPIETAPKDKELLLGWYRTWPEPSWEVAAGLAGSTKGGWLHGQATHWMPQPGPPLPSTDRVNLPGHDETMANLDALTISSTPRCTCAAIVNPNIPHARSCPLSTDRGTP